MRQLEPLEEATNDLLELFTRDSSGRWCFNSLNKDGSRLDKIMEQVSTFTPRRPKQVEEWTEFQNAVYKSNGLISKCHNVPVTTSDDIRCTECGDWCETI